LGVQILFKKINKLSEKKIPFFFRLFLNKKKRKTKSLKKTSDLQKKKQINKFLCDYI
jgi:hypothetical protein